jgi:hypothetical protein
VVWLGGEYREKSFEFNPLRGRSNMKVKVKMFNNFKSVKSLLKNKDTTGQNGIDFMAFNPSRWFSFTTAFPPFLTKLQFCPGGKAVVKEYQRYWFNAME